MGLRINTNINVLTAINNLQVTHRNLQQSITRLSTGKRINSGSDDPSGLVISEQLKSQLSSLTQAVQNSQSASDMISTADAALSGISNALTTLQGSIEFALNAGGASAAQISAQQNLVDQTVAAIDRIANTSRFGSNSLLNGSNAYKVTTPASLDADSRPILQNLNFKSIYAFSPTTNTRPFTITVPQLPQRAEIRFSGIASVGNTAQVVASGAGNPVILRITGNLGTQNVSLSSGSNTAQIAGAINLAAGFTGVIASAVPAAVGGPAVLTLYSSDFGLAQQVRVEVLQGALRFENTNNGTNVPAGVAPGLTGVYTRNNDTSLNPTGLMTNTVNLTTGKVAYDVGKDGQVQINGQTFVGTGVHFNVNDPDSFFSFDLNRDGIIRGKGGFGYTSGATASFTLVNNGLTFQLGDQPAPTDQLNVGIQGMMASLLGVDQFRDVVSEAVAGSTNFAGASTTSFIYQGGVITSLETGNANSLANNPKNALVIVQNVINQVAQLRAFLGAVSAYNIQPQINSLNVSSQNLQAATSDIADTDYAAEVANFTKFNIISQAGIQVLANTNTISQQVLGLLRQ